MVVGLLGILLGLAGLVWLSFRGWSVLVLAPAAALVAALAAGEPLLASWTIIFMGAAAGFILQFFPLFLLGAVFGKLMDDSGSVTAIARFMTEKLGPQRAMLAVVLAGAFVTYGGVSLFVAFFVLGAHGTGAVSRGRHPESPAACGRRARHDDLHDVGGAGHAGDPERHSDAVLRHHAICGARPRVDRYGHHTGFRPVVAGARGSRRAARRRRLRRGPAPAPTRAAASHPSANARPPRARSIRRKFVMATRAPNPPARSWRRCL